jgi:hypothetical protein
VLQQHTGSQNKTKRTKQYGNNRRRNRFNRHHPQEIDLTDITRNIGPSTLISITKARREIRRQLQTRVCADPHTHDHGHSYLVWNNTDWLKKRQVTQEHTMGQHI